MGRVTERWAESEVVIATPVEPPSFENEEGDDACEEEDCQDQELHLVVEKEKKMTMLMMRVE